MQHLLIADDNRQISTVLCDYARKEGYTTKAAHDGEAALALFEAEPFDMVLLDVMMPKKDGFAVCKAIRAVSNVPVIMVTARGEDYEKIMGLDIGADDYIVKPFSPREVMARIRTVLRRIEPRDNRPEQTLLYDNLELNIDTYTATVGGAPLSLTKKEMELLWTFASQPGRVFTRDNLLDIVWGYDYYGDNRTVDSHIKRLRAKLEPLPHPGWDISTIWGVGYKLDDSTGAANEE